MENPIANQINCCQKSERLMLESVTKLAAAKNKTAAFKNQSCLLRNAVITVCYLLTSAKTAVSSSFSRTMAFSGIIILNARSDRNYKNQFFFLRNAFIFFFYLLTPAKTAFSSSFSRTMAFSGIIILNAR